MKLGVIGSGFEDVKLKCGVSEQSISHSEQRDIVVGDVNSTMVCTITAKKLGIRVAHVEAGRRSRDMGVPEEIIGSAPMCYVI